MEQKVDILQALVLSGCLISPGAANYGLIIEGEG